MSHETTLVIEGLTNAEVLDLESKLGSGNVQRRQPEKGRHNYGVLDPVTAIVVVSGMSIAAISLWLAKRRKRVSTSIVATIHGPNNTTKTLEIHREEYEENTDAEAAKVIGEQLHNFLQTT